MGLVGPGLSFGDVKLAAHCEDFEQPAVGNWLELKIEHVQSSVVARN